MSKPSFKQALRQLAVWRLRQSGPHPSPEELLGYVKQSISGAMADRIQHHLPVCPGCAKTVLELNEAEKSNAGIDLAAEWKRFTSRISARILSGGPDEAADLLSACIAGLEEAKGSMDPKDLRKAAEGIFLLVRICCDNRTKKAREMLERCKALTGRGGN